MQNWLSLIRLDAGPRYAAIADAIAGAIRSGALRPGERLPTHRELAGRLGVDLTTVTRAYGLVRDAGLVEGAGKLGTFVRNDVALPKFGETASEAGMNVPPQPSFNLLPEAIRSGMAALLRSGRHSPILQYQPSIGNISDRARGAAMLTARGIPTRPEQIAITAGSQHALHGVVAALLKPRDRICCAPFIYPGMIALAKRYRLQLVAVPSDEEGMLPDALDAALRAGARTIYLTPTIDNPTTATMGQARRGEIVAVARQHDAIILEDDAYGPLLAEPHPPCAALAPECCWHIAGTSKLISPVIRIAYVRAPSAREAAMLATDISETAVMAPPLNAALVSLWHRSGQFAELVSGVRAESIARQRIVASQLASQPYRAHREGYHFWLDLRGRTDADALVARVAALGLSAVPGRVFDVSGSARSSHMRVSVGGAIDYHGLERALSVLAEALASRA
ncbi:PLP-dependent aminotransferase family protein [Sphingobium nicotianae]|uniref:PLP-dependent aminotransferase family protein n=1 Tax=Sphingobium nicotianae TaxID=2782607 RepID=A0A9X1DFP2_9SPHN|nr:PLP-dependent aminotransferase family protein [Sphingobium nicotianae]MBT2189125.1 PLP-dependent aminotransferase family protein [Sphingobium nicotianae]